ncbi:hypothetical protein FVEN_g2924 [Fusarium venenatum]|uniref:Phospholipase/carboxylesterase/thioesterase domain-containing protein n=1 Tax=Fusarium venenatum TaxID=56646 RepID=A0A2L2SY39_9HYPO|nr:uncharacterized protein FVRRES_06304 [Fusarium venenatum]KAG8359260.1 hypothetical protein FVEN_g2924 [Fusarium venenatum]KAH6993313.1 Alpha/Beta hydrolase protein [Fusarium venenatum]CEI61868.1 unnamed protein product [Fusarium venenatum]
MSTDPYIVEPTRPHTHSLILLHGLGSNGEKFGRELIETGISSDGKSLPVLLPGGKFIFPTSQTGRSSVFRRVRVTQWFNVASLDGPYYRNETQLNGMEESLREIFRLINQERERVPDKNIILGGISQGCAIGFMCLLAMEYSLGGYIGISSWLPFAAEFEGLTNASDDASFSGEDDNPFAASDDEDDQGNTNAQVHGYARELLLMETEDSSNPSSLSTPVFIGHGKADEKVKPELGEGACRILRSVGYDVQWKGYAGLGHWYKVPDEIDDILDFIREKVGWLL